MKKVGRNEPCPCGSGKKYKNCHQQEEQKLSKNKNIIIAALIALAFIISAIGLYWNSQSTGKGAPGEAPKGKVWSEEHGHWHDLP